MSGQRREHITFIGGGNMARALIGGLLSDTEAPARAIHAVDPVPAAREALAKDLNEALAASNSTLHMHETADTALAGCTALVLAVKPQILPAVVSSLSLAECAADVVVISIAAGVPLAVIDALLQKSVSEPSSANALVRCMPNTPALIGRGITALHANDACSEDQRRLAELLLLGAGDTLWVDTEQDLDAVTALSGSGPAYAFLLAETMTQAGVKLGLSETVAQQLAVATVAGAGQLAYASTHSPATLRTQVTSPGGTTAAALDAFAAGGFPDLVARAMQAAHERSGELADAALQALHKQQQEVHVPSK